MMDIRKVLDCLSDEQVFELAVALSAIDADEVRDNIFYADYDEAEIRDAFKVMMIDPDEL